MHHPPHGGLIDLLVVSAATTSPSDVWLPSKETERKSAEEAVSDPLHEPSPSVFADEIHHRLYEVSRSHAAGHEPRVLETQNACRRAGQRVHPEELVDVTLELTLLVVSLERASLGERTNPRFTIAAGTCGRS
ncbi:MAG: hypothetical protein ACLFP4_13560, partial [Spirochaetales bacterium]